MSEYGILFGITDFFQKSVPRTASPHLHAVAEFLKDLSRVQKDNYAFDTAVHANDGIWAIYSGSSTCMLKPAQKHLSVLIWPEASNHERKELERLLETAADRGDATLLEADTSYSTWRVYGTGLGALSSFFRQLPAPTNGLKGSDISHPRYFPGIARDRALKSFEESGRRCPGVHVPAHMVDLRIDRIVFDHILPHSRGGASSEWNVQVLCAKCNARKAASAL